MILLFDNYHIEFFLKKTVYNLCNNKEILYMLDKAMKIGENLQF